MISLLRPALLLASVSLSAATPGIVTGSLDRLVEASGQPASEQYEAHFGGGESSVKKAQVSLKDAALRRGSDGIVIEFTKAGASVDIGPEVLRLPSDWTGFDRLELEVRPANELTLTVTVLLPRGRLAQSKTLSADQAATVSIDLTDMPLAAGTLPLYSTSGIRLEATGPGSAAGVVRLSALRLTPRTQPRGPVADAFGQRLHAEWPGKIRAESELRDRAQRELTNLNQAPRRDDLDEFGGWTKGPRFTTNGYFRVDRDQQGRWWLVTPTGAPFWSIGTTGVRVGSVNDTARAAGREALFTQLPKPGDAAWFSGRHWTTTGEVDLPGNVHFYRWNVLRKYGSFEAWRDRVLARWPAWGLNTIGAWSDDLVLDQQRVPHTRFLRARATVPGVPNINGFPDVWDERWSTWLEQEFAREAAPHREDRWLLGYFVDNEARWGAMRLLDVESSAKLRDAWLEFVRGRYSSIERLNAAWKTKIEDWDRVRSLRAADVPSAAAPIIADFEAHYAERYFSTVVRILKRHDPNHLYLGCRFVRTPPAPGIVAAAGRHVDVLSVNCYAPAPDPKAFGAWHQMAGSRPILIGEFDFPLESPRQLPPPWQAFTAEQRETMFDTFVRTWAAQPWALGCHWYQHADQPLLGRHSDGENQTVGFVDVTDTPYDHLVRAARAASRSMYQWHAQAAEAGPAGAR